MVFISIVTFKEVSKHSGEKKLLNKVNFQIYRNKFNVVVSDNIRTLKIIRKLLSRKTTPDTGEIKSRLYKKSKNQLGLVFRDNLLLKDRNIRENLNFILNIKGPVDEFRRINRVLEIVDLVYCKDLKPEDLTRHQLIRANIAQAILSFPLILILEDPLYKLDEVNYRSLLKVLKKINKMDITLVFLTTDPTQIPDKYYSNMITIKKGEILPEKNKKNKVFN